MAVNRTFAEILDAIRVEMQLDPGLISDDERKRFVNESLIDLGTLGCFEKKVDLEFVNGRANLPSDYIDYVGLYRDGVLIPPASTDSSQKGVVLSYPTLEVSGGETETLQLWYGYAPSKLELLTDRPDIPYGYDRAVIDFAVALAHRKNGNIGLYREYMSSYSALKNDLYHRLTNIQNARITRQIDSEASGSNTPGVFGDEFIL